MTQPKPWPRQADEYRIDTIRAARVGVQIAERVRQCVSDPRLREQLADVVTLFKDIELKMTQARLLGKESGNGADH